MAINSCLYDCRIYHDRTKPKRHRFYNRLVFFYLDLDELDLVAKSFRWISRNRFNFYEFRDGDHLNRGKNTVRENIEDYAASKGADLRNAKIHLLTNLRSLGYYFNPVSFYFCFDKDGHEPICVIAEVVNTFREMKLYFLGKEAFAEDAFKNRQPKYFYISPFIALDATFDFSIKLPSDNLDIKVNDIENGEMFFRSGITGKRLPISDWTLFEAFARHPLSTLKVISLIHWQAMLLYFKRIPHLKKEANPELQKETYRGWQR